MAVSSVYITDAQFQALLEVLNLTLTDPQKQELVDRAVGDLEGDLCERYVVPLVAADGGAFSTAPAFGKNKILNTIKAKIRQVIGTDNNRNLVIDSTEKYIDTHQVDYTRHIKTLLDQKKIFGFKLNEQSDDAVVPVQKIGLARADNEEKLERDPWVF